MQERLRAYLHRRKLRTAGHVMFALRRLRLAASSHKPSALAVGSSASSPPPKWVAKAAVRTIQAVARGFLVRRNPRDHRIETPPL